MRAATYSSYGAPEVIRVTEVETPTPRDNEVRIKIRATTVTAGDHRGRSLDMPAGMGFMGRLVFGLFGPRQQVLGGELSGVVDAIGKDVTRFAVGDEVFAFTDATMGCHAEYRCLPEDGKVARKPSGLSWEQAAALSFGGVTALHFLRRGEVKKGERVLVNGAAGAVGSACVQLARQLGAEVTAVCSTGNVERVRALGASHVIDYSREDFTLSGALFDVIIDTVGNAPYGRCKGSLTEGGRLLLVASGLYEMLKIPWISLTSPHKVIGGVALGSPDDLRFLAEAAQAGQFVPSIDRTFTLDEIVEAHRHVDTGHKKGNVVVLVG